MKSYGDADTLLTTFQQFPRWEHFIPTVGIESAVLYLG